MSKVNSIMTIFGSQSQILYLLKLTGFQTSIAVSATLTGVYHNLSFPRRRESTASMPSWMPASAGMTKQIGQFELLMLRGARGLLLSVD
jgi:hypothetical protein